MPPSLTLVAGTAHYHGAFTCEISVFVFGACRCVIAVNEAPHACRTCRDAMDARAALEDRNTTQDERIAELEQQADEARNSASAAEGKLAAAEQRLSQETSKAKELEASIQCDVTVSAWSVWYIPSCVLARGVGCSCLCGG